MRRIGIFVFHDKEGIVDKYIYKLLNGIVPFLEKLIIVCNGYVNEEGKAGLNEYADEVLIRENKGFDSGAYKDVILKLNKVDELVLYDELLLLNDTVFGCFYPLDDFFKTVEEDAKADFYGITKHPAGEWTEVNIKIAPHIQAYFLLIKQRMLHSNAFLDFWNKMQYPKNYTEAVLNFEVRFSVFFSENGFVGKSYCDVEKVGIPVGYNYNELYSNSLELIRDLKMPFLKIKQLYIESEYCIKYNKTVEYLNDHKLYDTEIIRNYIARTSRNKSYFDILKLQEFCKNYGKIYIYGAGKYGKRMKDYLVYNGYVVIDFIVSSNDDFSENVITLDELKNISSDVGIIMALNRENTSEVLPRLIKVIPKQQIYVGNIYLS